MDGDILCGNLGRFLGVERETHWDLRVMWGFVFIFAVSPLCGAWIETVQCTPKGSRNAKVSPLCGAWIETVQALQPRRQPRVAPVWGVD